MGFRVGISVGDIVGAGEGGRVGGVGGAVEGSRVGLRVGVGVGGTVGTHVSPGFVGFGVGANVGALVQLLLSRFGSVFAVDLPAVKDRLFIRRSTPRNAKWHRNPCGLREHTRKGTGHIVHAFCGSKVHFFFTAHVGIEQSCWRKTETGKIINKLASTCFSTSFTHPPPRPAHTHLCMHSLPLYLLAHRCT